MTYQRDLVFDLGLHKGEDTAYYLKKGFRVVAFEANPYLVKYCMKRFAVEVDTQRLHIISGAVYDGTAHTVNFFVNSQVSIWGTTDFDWVERNRLQQTTSEPIEVNRVDIGEYFHTFGIPYYLKIDIEGADGIVLDALKRQQFRPHYLSLETSVRSLHEVEDEVEALCRLGYSSFRPVQQATIPGMKIHTHSIDGSAVEHIFEDHASGAFGNDLGDCWLTASECLKHYRWIFLNYFALGYNTPLSLNPATRKFVRLIESARRRLHLLPAGWHDLHARLEPSK